jgi:AAA+ ATPase superfamily predicted ATPase
VVAEAKVFHWRLVNSFLDRRDELSVLEQWWSSDDRMPINLFGRRRVGKSWLFRRLAHGKPAVMIVAQRLPAGAQLGKFSAQLEPLLGVRPDLPDVASLFRVLFRVGRDAKLLAVIDEFPWLLPGNGPGDEETLSAIQAVF